MNALDEAPAALTLGSVQDALRPLLGTRYQLIERLDGHTTASRTSWRAYLADDTSLRRRVVVRVADRIDGDTSDLHQRVQRARHAAQLNAHLVTRVYDALIEGDPSMIAPPTTTAVIISEYFDGETLHAAIERGADLDTTMILAGLAHRVADAADAGVSFGSLSPANVVLTAAGPAIAQLPVGTVAGIGPTSLDALATATRTGRITRAVRRVRRASLRLAHSA